MTGLVSETSEVFDRKGISHEVCGDGVYRPFNLPLSAHLSTSRLVWVRQIQYRRHTRTYHEQFVKRNPQCPPTRISWFRSCWRPRPAAQQIGGAYVFTPGWSVGRARFQHSLTVMRRQSP